MTDKKKKNPDFSHEEICTLLEMFKENKSIVLSRFSNAVANKKTQSKWKDITEAVNNQLVSDNYCIIVPNGGHFFITKSDICHRNKHLFSNI